MKASAVVLELGIGAWMPGYLDFNGQVFSWHAIQAQRRHRIPRARCRVTNWRTDEAGLRRRGDLTFWIDETRLGGWYAPRRAAARQGAATLIQGGHRTRVDPAARVPFGLAASGRVRPQRAKPGGGPVHLVLGSTGLKLLGQGEWCAAKHGRLRQRWLKLHHGVDATTGEIAAHVLTNGDEDDAAQAAALRRQCDGTLASVIADGACDRDPVCQAAAVRQPGSPIEAIIPPRADAVLSTADLDQQSPRDRYIQLLAERGHIGWQRATKYGRRNHAETIMSRFGHLIEPKLHARSWPGQQGEVALAVQVLNRGIRTAKPLSIRH